jgi:type IV secretion system protein VirD4
MSATKILWGQIVIVFAIVLATMWAATQWVAWKLGYQPQLGQPWFELTSGIPIYLPPEFFWWWYVYDAYAPRVFVEGAYIASSGSCLPALKLYTPEQIDGRSIGNVVASSHASLHDRCS